MMTIKNILALGAGNMGGQVSFYHAMHGFNVTQFDISEEALANCKEQHLKYVEPFRAACPAFTDDEVEAGLARINYSSDLETAARTADLVTESVPEVLEIKHAVYADLNRLCPEHTIFTTNTSTLPPSAIAESTGRPERFLALHYAMGIWHSPIAEIMKHPGTGDTAFQAVVEFAVASKLVPIKLEKEQPGYIINSLLVPWLTAALSLVVNGVSSPQDVDKTWIICGQGMRVGPLGVLDMLGFEVCLNVNRLLAEADPDNPQYPKNIEYLEKNFIDKGHMGILSGQGFYSYPDPEYLKPEFLL
jgi:3-hydroxybutyryl-CoA dehydrogenase